MTSRKILLLAIAGAVGLTALVAWQGCRKTPARPPTEETSASDPFEPKQAQPKLDTIKLWLGSEELITEMAVTAQQERTGMMFRTTMAENEGMIFVYDLPQRVAFWMKNCTIPLSIAYIDSEGVIREIHDLQPQDTNSVFSTSDRIRFALEVPQGWFKRHNIHEGMTVRTERGSLPQTFDRNR